MPPISDLRWRPLGPRFRRLSGSPTARPVGACRAGESHPCSSCRPPVPRLSRSPDIRPRHTLKRLSAAVSRPPRDARFQVTATGRIVIRPSAPGLLLDLPATAKAITRPHSRLTVGPPTSPSVSRSLRVPPRSRRRWASRVSCPRTRRRTAARPGRLNNVQLVAKLIDGTLIKPGAGFRSTTQRASGPRRRDFRKHR